MKEIITTPVRSGATNNETGEYLIYFFFGLLESLLAFRLLLKLAGASVSSGFVRFIYGITGIFTLPFQGMFRQASVSTSVFEPATLVAIFVYILIAWGIVRLIRISSGEQQES
ncbi:MAG: YggT family protein [Microgenomates group bacterium]